MKELQVLHCVEIAIRLSVVFVVRLSAIDEAILGFKTCRLHQLLFPDGIQGDNVLNTGVIKKYIGER